MAEPPAIGSPRPVARVGQRICNKKAGDIPSRMKPEDGLGVTISNGAPVVDAG